MKNERALLRRAKRCDEKALGELYDLWALRIYAYICRRVSDSHLAEDLTADVFIRVLQAVRTGHSWRTSFQTWIYRIAHNLVVDHYRRKPPDNDLALDDRQVAVDDDPISAVATRFSNQRLGAAIRRLTVDQQQVLALRFGEGMTAREAAQVVGKSVGAVEALQHRALAALRRILEKDTYG